MNATTPLWFRLGRTARPRSGRSERPLTTLALFIIRTYQVLLSPLVGGACRFTPTCSVYAIEAIERHGAGRGLWLATRRIVRCHPWGGAGFDPVPSPDESIERGR